MTLLPPGSYPPEVCAALDGFLITDSRMVLLVYELPDASFAHFKITLDAPSVGWAYSVTFFRSEETSEVRNQLNKGVAFLLDKLATVN